MGHIFISYSHTDTTYAQRLTQALTDAGFNVWIDERIDYGSQWPHKIQEHLDTCTAFIVLMTPRSYDSEWVQSELSRAKRKKKPIFPLLLEGDEPWLSVESLQYVDVTGGKMPQSRFFEQLGQVIPPTAIPSVSPIDELTKANPDEPFAVPNLRWRNIPAGNVTVHYPNTDQTFKVDPFRISIFPVTAQQFDLFINDPQGYDHPAWWGFSQSAQTWHKANPKPADQGFLGDAMPRINVSWYEAIAFCRWLSHKLGQEITLPTEQQWQFAAQGTDERLYPWGNTFDSKRLNIGRLAGILPVSSFPNGISPYGIYDMVGNVWEWCLTDYETGRNDNVGEQALRVLRGGSWFVQIESATNTARAMGNSNNATHGRSNGVGFRLVTGHG